MEPGDRERPRRALDRHQAALSLPVSGWRDVG
jgi:hypothetical protein